MPTPTEESAGSCPVAATTEEMTTIEMSDSGLVLPTGKKSRHRSRKSKLYTDIRTQMEFYFSDANLTKQRVMKEIMQASEYVPLSIFVEKFNKLSQLSKNVEDVRRALKNSDKLVLSEDGSGVKRKVPFDETKVKSEEVVENCTIYVENIPTHVNHEWVMKIFQEFGQVAYVSLPHFKRSKQPKGFAFVEFEDEDAAKRCLEAFGEMGGCLPTNIDPSVLMSITTFNDEKEADSSSKNEKGRRNLRKRTRAQAALTEDVDVDEVGEKRSKSEKSEEVKVKLDEGEEGEEVENPEKHSTNTSKIENESEIKTELNPESEEMPPPTSEVEDTTKTTKKKKRKNRKKNTPGIVEEKLESDLIHLKILPKRNWRQLRSRYLNLQRENFGKLKAQLRNCAAQLPFVPQQTATGQYKSVCVRISLQSPPESREALVSQITSEVAPTDWNNFVKYVDYEGNGTLEAIVRLDGGPGAGPGISDFIKSASSVFQKATFMSEKETDEYWARCKVKLKENRKNAKIRGKDRLLNQATKLATSHIHFEDTTAEGDSSTTKK